jgi:hypothetical protein
MRWWICHKLNAHQQFGALMAEVAKLAEYRNRDSLELLHFLQERFGVDEMRGIILQCVDRWGNEQVHMTGVYRQDPARAASACMSMSVKMTMAAGGFTEP